MASKSQPKGTASTQLPLREEYEWEKLPDMPTARCYSIGVYHLGKLYVIGGCDRLGVPIEVAEVYDFATRKWSSLPNMPTKRAAASGCIVWNNKIFVVGGVTEGQKPIAAVDCFNIETQKWEAFPPLPVGVVGPFVKLIDDKLYVIAGTNKKDNEFNQSLVFDSDKNAWLPLPPKPSPCYACGGYLYDRKLYIVGGRKGNAPVQAVDVFDLDTQQWEAMTPMHSLRVFYSVVGIEDEIYVIGGLVPQLGISKIVEKYSIHEDMWARSNDLAEIRSDSGYGIVGDRIVVAGGLGGQGLRAMDTGEGIKQRKKKGFALPKMSKPRSSVSSLSFDGKLALLNGVGDGGPQKIVEILSIKDKQA